MKKIDIRTLACCAALIAGVQTVKGGQVTTLAALNPNDFVDWGQFGPSGTAVNGPSASYMFLASLNGGNTIGVYPKGVLESALPATWDFPGTLLGLDNQFTGPIGMTFPHNVMGVGFYISSAFGGAFTASLSTFTTGGTLINSYTEPGGPASPVVFIGSLDATADIGGILVSMTNGSGNNYFALDTLEVVDAVSSGPSGPATGAPEPASLLLAASALIALAALRGKRGRGASVSTRIWAPRFMREAH